MSRKSGFTILELLVIITILGVILLLAVPPMLRARKGANEASAIASLRRLTCLNEQYRLRFSSYAADISMLKTPGLPDGSFEEEKRGYSFRYRGDLRSWNCFAIPDSAEEGDRAFYLDETGVIRGDEFGRIGSESPSIDSSR